VHGTAVQVEPIKPVLKAPGFTRLKLIYDEPLSSFGFNFNLRRYCTAECAGTSHCDEDTRECVCAPGYGGDDCARLMLPACEVSPGFIAPFNYPRLSCECLEQWATLLRAAWLRLGAQANLEGGDGDGGGGGGGGGGWGALEPPAEMSETRWRECYVASLLADGTRLARPASLLQVWQQPRRHRTRLFRFASEDVRDGARALDFRVGGEEEGDDATSGVSVVPDVNVTRARVTVTREDYDLARMDNTSLSECPAECGRRGACGLSHDMRAATTPDPRVAGPAIYCSSRHRLLSDSRNKGSTCVTMTRRVASSRP